MGTQFLTGMWACDLQKSSDLASELKEKYNKVIEDMCNDLIKTKNIKILCNQFRGDGRLLVFDTQNMQKNLFQFAVDFCAKINKEKEKGTLNDFSIRTYIHIGSVNVDNDKAVGADVDEFCRLIDNKNNDRIDVPEKYSSIMICTSECYRYLDETAKQILSQCTINGKDYYTCEFRPNNLIIQLLYSNKIPIRKIWAIIQE